MLKSNLSILLFIVFLSGCSNHVESNEHSEFHEFDILPFWYESSFENGELTLSITSKDSEKVYFPSNYLTSSFIDSKGRYFIGDLFFSTEKANTDIRYFQEEFEDGRTTRVVLILSKNGRVLQHEKLTIAIHMCEDCEVAKIQNNQKQHYRGHVVGKNNKFHRRGHFWNEHYHIPLNIKIDD